MCKYDLVIWDVDGTLLDTSEGIIEAAKYTILNEGLPLPNQEVFNKYIGPPIQRSFVSSLAVSEEKAVEMANKFRERYKNEELYKATLYPHVLELLNDLNDEGVYQAIATYKRQDYAERLLHHFGMSEYVNAIYGSDLEGRLTKKDIIEKAIIGSGIHQNTQTIVMIGDTDNDMLGAKELEIDFIAVTYGFGFKDSDSLPKEKCCMARSVEEIRLILEV